MHVPRLAIAAASFTIALPALGQPTNDQCASATVVTSLPFSSGPINWADATTDLANPSCDYALNFAGAKYGVWFAFTPATTGSRILSQTMAINHTVVSIWVGSCPTPATQLGCQDADPFTEFAFTAGTRYLLLLSKWGNTTATGTVALTIADSAPVPANDRCTGARTLALGGSPLSATDQADNSGATSTGDGPIGACAPSTRAIWWKLVPEFSGTYQVDLCGTGFDTVLSVLTTTDCTTFNELACNDDSESHPPICTPQRLASKINSVLLAAGSTYYLRAGSFTTATGLITINVTFISSSGACCQPQTGGCTFSPTGEPGCAGGKIFIGGGCEPNPCPQPAGACCCGSTCAAAAANQCTGTGRTFIGAGASCNQPGNSLFPCCLADFNRSGAVSVQDIFDFLGGYFTIDACADINLSGTVSVQDIFDYLGAYFLGCP